MRVLYCGVKSGQKYPEKVRHFCLALSYYSPRAYQYVRKEFNNHLPHIKTIRNWFANSDIKSDPGIQPEHMTRLEKIAQQFEIEHGRKLMCSLVFDEMHIRQQVFWLLQQLNFNGFVNYGQDEEEEEKAIAKEAIVFILNGIEANFEFPVAYYFIDKLTGQQRKNLISDIIEAVTKCGIKITNLTFDGLSANAVMCLSLGADFDVYSKDFKTYILNPVSNEKIYIMLDPCHMLKLVRNTLGNRLEFFAENKCNKIEWRYIESLYTYSRENNLHTHRLTKKHINWMANKMNVRIAAQTFGNSVADSLQFLMEQKIPEFQNAGSTIDFIRRINILFDIFNSKRSKHANIFKQVLSAENKRIIFDFFKETIKYFKLLKVEEPYYVKEKKSKTCIQKLKFVPLLKTRNKCAFRGFIIDMETLMGMYTEYIEEGHLLTTIATYNLLQDVIEMLFGRIRVCGAFNNNPNVQQFKGAFRKIQANMKLDLSLDSNCRLFDSHLPDDMFYSNVYFVSSKRGKIELDETIFEQQKDSILTDIAELDSSFESIDNFDAMVQTSHMGHMLDSTPNFTIACIASSIEKKIMECKSFHCSDCLLVFNENKKEDNINTSLIRWKPCTSTIQICKTSEKFFKLYDIQKLNPRFDFRVLYCLIFRSMNLDALFPISKFNCDFNHKYQFIKCIVGQYITIRANQISKEITLGNQTELIRTKYNRLVNTKGQ